MIIFHKITIKNFLSYGNVPTTFDLDKFKNTLIIGANGQGKSVLADAVCFALYGKPYRNITKGQLLNSINQKALETEIHFSVGNSQYRVVRGIRPNTFEIYHDGKLIDQEAAVKDYQGFLESQILKINYKTFCQVVVIGSANFTPFMQLSTGARRDVIEDVLDIAVFSVMNNVLKSRINETRDELKIIEKDIESAKKESQAQLKVIKILKEAKTTRINEEQKHIDTLQAEIANHQIRLEQLHNDLNSLDEKLPYNAKDHEAIKRSKDFLEADIKKMRKRISEISEYDTCPTCMQNVSDEHKKSIDLAITIDIEEKSNETKQLIESLDRIKKIIEHNDAVQEKIDLIHSEEKEIQGNINRLQNDINSRTAIIRQILSDEGDIAKEEAHLKQIANSALEHITRKSELLEEKNLQEISSILLKDSGIKAAIIKEYVPVINKFVNKYLGMFGFHINFQLDENFNESIKSRGRDEFSYASFSEGEKRKIDVAILFAFRKVTEMKNSANCNLLIADEIVDSSLDLNSREAFMEILGQSEGNNFVISHTAQTHEMYDAVIKVEKVGDFSKYEYV